MWGTIIINMADVIVITSEEELKQEEEEESILAEPEKLDPEETFEETPNGVKP